jgi:hypothetical protein
MSRVEEECWDNGGKSRRKEATGKIDPLIKLR